MRAVMTCWLLAVAIGACGGAAAGGEAPATASEVTEAPAPLDRSNTECVTAALSSTDATTQVACLLQATESDHLFVALNLHDTLTAKLATLEGRAGREAVKALLADVDRLFETARLQQQFEAQVVTAYDAEHARAALTYYGSESGRHYAALGAVEPDDGALGAWMDEVELSETRSGLVARLRVAGQIPQLVESMVVVPGIEMTQAMAPLAPPGATLPTEAQLRESIAPVVSALDRAMTMTYAYLMRDLSDAELEAITAFEESAAAQWLSTARTQAMRAVMMEAYRGLGQSIAQHMPPAASPATK